MGYLIDLKDKVFGTLTVLEYAGKNKHKKTMWLVQCACGNRTSCIAGHLLSGKSTKCRQCQNVKHGHTRGKGKERLSSTWISWTAMRERCTKLSNIGYKYYGGRGIKVCDRWLSSFENFLTDMGERPEGQSLDRINPDGNYEPGNCRWATNTEQALNKRPYTVWNKGMKIPFKTRRKKSNPHTGSSFSDFISPPGGTLADILEERGLSHADLAERTGRPIKTINEIIKGKAALTSDTAIQLERVLGVPAEFWNQREANYRAFKKP